MTKRDHSLDGLERTAVGAWNIIGNEWAIELLRLAIARNSASHAYLLTGLPNIGKATLALHIAQALNCEHNNGDVCGECRACKRIAKGNFPDVRIVGLAEQAAQQKASESVKTRLGIDTVREWQADIALRPYEGRRRVFIMHDAETMTEQAANALLKTLEEPPPFATLILVANSAGDLLPTITSRCHVLKLRPVPRQQVTQALIERWQIAPADAAIVAAWSAGRIGWAATVAQSPDLLQARAEQLESLIELPSKPLVERFKWAESWSKANRERDELFAMLELWQVWWRDVLLTAAGTEQGLINIDRIEDLQALARLPLPAIHKTLKGINDAVTQIRENVSPQLALEGVLLNLAGAKG
ncbi:DNA polymerase III subunit delta' [Herpetosiphon geysericola]|uniref:DNA polymerase III subunit delta' n=1 Tax=Herpetosiphon geysericola TaxID=70996 RepID=A0A0P6YP40_9CHLR|nr:DNA polymerase III subunit delta' [Herpetosiphon geysericola]KPL87023.1 DNA polymerase III subunit delta' [Herpetosiphon geysericola]